MYLPGRNCGQDQDLDRELVGLINKCVAPYSTNGDSENQQKTSILRVDGLLGWYGVTSSSRSEGGPFKSGERFQKRFLI